MTIMTNTTPLLFVTKTAICIFMLINITGCEFDAISERLRKRKLRAQNKEILCYSTYLLRLIYVTDSILYEDHKRIISSGMNPDLKVISNELDCDSSLVLLKQAIHSI